MLKGAFGGVVLLLAAVAVACSGRVDSTPGGEHVSKEGKQGQVGLTLQPVSGVSITAVSYRVTQGVGGAVVKSGNLPVPGTGADFSFGVPLPVGTGYVLSLEATSVDGAVACTGGAPPFSISANQSVDVTATLTCVDITKGQPLVDVNVTTTACPDITFDYVVAVPRGGDIGQSLSLLSQAVSASGTPLTYSWAIASPGVGTFANPNLRDVTLTCTSFGPDMPVTVTASNGECSKSLTTRISCIPTECGDGKVDLGETCDKALDPTCPADCTQICGDGVVEGFEQCEPPNTLACRADCTSRPIECGDGFLQPGEACDYSATPTGAPPGVPCEHDCTIIPISIVHCGNGILENGESCDPLVPYSIEECGGAWGPVTAIAQGGRDSACQRITSAACLSCEQASECAELVGTSLLTGNAIEGPAQGVSRKALYNEVLDCVRDTHCATGLVIDCYCGTASSAQCDAGNGNGACRGPIERGTETTNPSDVQARLTNLTLGGGLALARVQCDQNNCTQCL